MFGFLMNLLFRELDVQAWFKKKKKEKKECMPTMSRFDISGHNKKISSSHQVLISQYYKQQQHILQSVVI